MKILATLLFGFALSASAAPKAATYACAFYDLPFGSPIAEETLRFKFAKDSDPHVVRIDEHGARFEFTAQAQDGEVALDVALLEGEDAAKQNFSFQGKVLPSRITGMGWTKDEVRLSYVCEIKR